MDIFSVFTMLGGLAFFLFGMNILGAGLDKLAGGRLERILEKLTSNPIKSVALGAVVTAIIQSSSATTVMVVGFVNSGIMKLHQAIGIIMGANLGTTATSWILSLSGLEGDSFIVKIFKPTSFSPVLAFIGIILFSFAKSQKKKDIGNILLGFAILMFGMETMSDAVKPLADIPEFRNILTMFSNPILGVFTGALLTAIIQSSSASVGILQAISITGSLTYGAAIPIIMGQNIGTCITAMLSSIGANKNAKRAALVHLYFNLIGSIAFLLVFYAIQYTIGFPFFDDSVNAVSIAVVHTIFNLFSTALMLPFTRFLEKLACLTIKDTEVETNVSNETELDVASNLLDERFLATPGFAVEQCKDVVQKMALLSRETFHLSLELLQHYDETKAKQIFEKEDLIDKYEDILGTYLVQLSSKSLSTSDSQAVSKFLHTIGDFERIGDHAVNLRDAAKEIYEKQITFSAEAQNEINVITQAVSDILDQAINAFLNNDLVMASQVEALEEVIDYLRNECKNRHVDRLRSGLCTIEFGFVFNDILTNYERVSDHCSNIAVCLLEINENSFETHDYLNKLKYSGSGDFTKAFERNKEKYALPN